MMTFNEALQKLGLIKTPKVTLQDVKKTYRVRAFKNHPDRGGDPDEFCVLQEAYELLLEHADQLTREEDVAGISYTDDGYPIDALGRGLGFKDVMGSKVCENCDGRGYTTVQTLEQIFEPSSTCRKCKGMGILMERCPKCRGYGKIMGKICPHCDGKKRIYAGICPACQGRGWFMGYGYQEVERLKVRRCNRCAGTGEIELFNPVIPRNVVTR